MLATQCCVVGDRLQRSRSNHTSDPTTTRRTLAKRRWSNASWRHTSILAIVSGAVSGPYYYWVPNHA